MSIQRKDRLPALIISACFLLQWALLMVVVTPVWDAAFYYAYARSTLFDGDLALENDLLLSYPTAGEQFVNKQAHANLTSTGRVFSTFAIGSAILTLPILALTRLVLLPFAAFSSGYEWPYLAVAGIFSAVLGLLTFWLTYRMTATMTGRKTALAAVITLLFATPLIYYQFREPLYSHTATAFISAAVVVLWWRQGQSKNGQTLPGPAGALFMGGLLGLLFLVRWQQAIYAVLPLASVLLHFRQLPAGQRASGIRPAASYLLLVGLAGALVASLQLAQWRLFNGSWLVIPQGEGFMEWQAPYLGEVLFSPFRGLLFWMPVFFPAVFGLFRLARKRPGVIWPLIIILFLALYVNSSTQDWFGGGGYGPRKFTGELLILGLGYAGFLAAFRPRFRWSLAGVLGIFLAWHQWILLRFGLAERFGGRVLSTYPFLAESDPAGSFLQQFAPHLADVFRRPGDFLILPGSPLDLWLRQDVFPWQHLIGLVVVLLFVWGVWWLFRRYRAVHPWLLAGLVIVILGNLWLAVWA